MANAFPNRTSAISPPGSQRLNAPRRFPFIVARIVLQDFTGVPLLVDLACDAAPPPHTSASARNGLNPSFPSISSLITPSRLISQARPTPLRLNMEMEFKRNQTRYQFLKWGTQAFKTFSVVPPGIGIVHQVNLEYLAKGVLEKNGVWYPDTLVGTDSHTTMINGLGIVGWGVGGIEAEAGMLGQPVYFLTPMSWAFISKANCAKESQRPISR
jgi:aconitate hydratase